MIRFALILLVALAACAPPPRLSDIAPEPMVILPEPAPTAPPMAEAAPCTEDEDDGIGGTGCTPID